MTDKVTTVGYKRAQAVPFARCTECDGDSEMVPIEVAAKRARVTSRTMYRVIEAGHIHFDETADGSLLLCSVSLAALKF